jgi:hypothetical protein
MQEPCGQLPATRAEVSYGGHQPDGSRSSSPVAHNTGLSSGVSQGVLPANPNASQSFHGIPEDHIVIGDSLAISKAESDNMRRIFDQFDRNQSNTIDIGELQDCLRAIGHYLTVQQVEELMEEVTESPNKKELDFFEFMKLILFWKETARFRLFEMAGSIHEMHIDLASRVPPFISDAVWRWWWDLIMLIIIVFLCCDTPLYYVERIRTYSESGWIARHSIATVFLLADFLIWARTSKVVRNTNRQFIEEVNCSPQGFSPILIVDFLAMIPWTLIPPPVGNWLAWIRLGKVMRIQWLWTYSGLVPVDFKYVLFHYSTLPIIIGIALFIMFVHAVAAIALYQEAHLRYATAIYYAMYCVSGVGFGDVIATVDTNGKRWFTAFVVMGSMVVNGYVVGNLVSYFQSTDVESEKRSMLRETSAVCSFFEIPEALANEITQFQDYVLRHKLALVYSDLLKDLPSEMKTQLQVYSRMRLLAVHPIFGQAHQGVQVAIAQFLDSCVYCPEEFVIIAGEEADESYFIAYGFVDVASMRGLYLATLKQFDYFGDSALMVPGLKRCISVKALCYCDLFVLSRESMQKIVQRYPLFRRQVRKKEEEYRERFLLSSDKARGPNFESNGGSTMNSNLLESQDLPETAEDMKKLILSDYVTLAIVDYWESLNGLSSLSTAFHSNDSTEASDVATSSDRSGGVDLRKSRSSVPDFGRSQVSASSRLSSNTVPGAGGGRSTSSLTPRILHSGKDWSVGRHPSGVSDGRPAIMIPTELLPLSNPTLSIPTDVEEDTDESEGSDHHHQAASQNHLITRKGLLNKKRNLSQEMDSPNGLTHKHSGLRSHLALPVLHSASRSRESSFDFGREAEGNLQTQRIHRVSLTAGVAPGKEHRMPGKTNNSQRYTPLAGGGGSRRRSSVSNGEFLSTTLGSKRSFLQGTFQAWKPNSPKHSNASLFPISPNVASGAPPPERTSVTGGVHFNLEVLGQDQGHGQAQGGGGGGGPRRQSEVIPFLQDRSETISAASSGDLGKMDSFRIFSRLTSNPKLSQVKPEVALQQIFYCPASSETDSGGESLSSPQGSHASGIRPHKSVWRHPAVRTYVAEVNEYIERLEAEFHDVELLLDKHNSASPLGTNEIVVGRGTPIVNVTGSTASTSGSILDGEGGGSDGAADEDAQDQKLSKPVFHSSE